MRKLSILLTLCFAFHVSRFAFAAPDSPYDDRTPYGLIKSQTAIVAAGGATAARDRMHVTVERFKPAADALAQLDAATSKLKQSVIDKWGDDALLPLAHALGTMATADLEAATIDVQGDHATVHWKDVKAPTYFLRDEAGHWKLDLDKGLSLLTPEQLQQTLDFYQKLTPIVQKLQKDFDANKFPSDTALAKTAHEEFNKLAEKLKK